MSSIRPFQVLVKPVGADCNLRCDYCFYLRAKELYPTDVRRLMSDTVLETLIAGMMGHRFPETVFSWQGGEPTLAGVDFFQRVVALQQRHGASGQVVANAFQTNGVLLDDAWGTLFRDYRFLVGLSLDGPQAAHDAIRKNGAGEGTWEAVMASARLLARYGVAFNVLCVVHAGNVGLGRDLLRWFVDEGFDFVQFIPCCEAGSPHNVSPAAYGDFLCDVFDYWAQDLFGKISVRDFEALMAASCGMPAGVCTYGRKCDSYIVIEHTGDVYPCDFFVQDAWKLGNILETPIEQFLVSERYKTFSRQKHAVMGCNGCPWRAMCHGGCLKDRASVSGATLDRPSPFCTSYIQFFMHAAPCFKGLLKRAERLTRGRVR